MLTFEDIYCILSKSYGGVAQLARAFGSYPKGQWFESTHRYHTISGLVVKRLIHRPFTAELGVRFPSRSPSKQKVNMTFFLFTIKLNLAIQ